jgi:hypothetical protein
VTGAGLGYGLAKGGLDLLEQIIGTRQAPATAGEALLGGARDVLTGATYETAGRVAAPIVSAALQKFGASATRALDVKGRQATKIAREIGELTYLPGVGPDLRDAAIAAGI